MPIMTGEGREGGGGGPCVEEGEGAVWIWGKEGGVGMHKVSC